ncbi:hypothetical protein [Mameliella alba]|uniref:hypothetical protein n=1 Tax=Mameliella alba TaxID=561184 RepID=UPI000B530660|nr:hypothetical protein [Mameliella alba]OWV39219.1 hypothetical protein CDZ95_27270 [Mameliella alba]
MSFASNNAGPSATARVAVNGLIIWLRIIGVLIAKMVATRLLLEAMGIEGYGAYFAATSIALLVGFLTSAMQATSVRAISLERTGEAAMSRLFSSLLGMHLLVGLAIMAIGATGGLWFVNAVLVIPEAMSDAAAFSFLCILMATAFGALLGPYEAFLQSRERFAIYASLDMLRAWLLVPVSYYLTQLEGGQLEIYAMISAGLSIVTIMVGVVIALRDYPATRPRLRDLFDATIWRPHASIFSWSLVGSLSAVARNQGLAVVVNTIGGPVASAAFAIGNQIPAAVRQFATSLRTVIAPRIYGREARGDRNLMVGLSFTACKVSMLVAVVLVVPLVVELPTILQTWLGQADSSIIFVCSLMLVNQVVEQSSAGTGLAHMAIGQLARLQIIAGGLSLLMLPVAYAVGYSTGEFRNVLLVAVGFTILVAIVRVKLLDKHVSRATLQWLRETILRVIAVLLPMLVLALAVHEFMEPSLYRLVLNFGATFLLFLIMAYTLGLTAFERDRVRELFRWRGKAA